MKYLYEQERITCISLEQELGLTRGDIKELIIYPDGAGKGISQARLGEDARLRRRLFREAEDRVLP